MEKRTIITMLIIIAAIILFNISISGSLAYMKRVDEKENNFTIGTINPEIIETNIIEDNIKENVQIKNNGNYPIYIRVANVFYFTNNDGQIIKDIPVIDVDYSINFSSSSNWLQNTDGYYYYKLMLEPEEITDIFIEECFEINKMDDRKVMMVIVVGAIQGSPERAVKETWGVNLVNNVITTG